MIRYSYLLVEPLADLAGLGQLQPRLARLRDLGYQGVEVNATVPLGVDAGWLRRECDRLGLTVPSFLTGAACRDGLCLASPDPGVRRRTAQRLVDCLDLAEPFGAVLVVGLLQGQRTDEPDPVVANQRIAEGLGQVAEAAEGRGVDLVVEPVNHLQVGFNHTVDEVCRLIAAIGSPAVKPMVDTIHMNIEESSLVDPIARCGPRLRHVHLCESNGSFLGTGHVDFAAVLRALGLVGYDGFASVKVYRGASFDQAAASSLDYLRSLS